MAMTYTDSFRNFDKILKQKDILIIDECERKGKVKRAGNRKTLTNLTKLRGLEQNVKIETKRVEIMNSLKTITIFEHFQTHGDIFETKERRFAYEAHEDPDSDVP